MAFYELLSMIHLLEFDLCITDSTGDVGLYYPGNCVARLKFGKDLLNAEIIRYTVDIRHRSIFVLIKGDVL